jgi:hypothetical protein
MNRRGIEYLSRRHRDHGGHGGREEGGREEEKEQGVKRKK